MEIGDKVIHRKYGKGKIENIDRELNIAMVKFNQRLDNGYRNKWIKAINLRTINEE